MSPGVRSAWFALLFPAFFIHPTAFSTRAVKLSGSCRTGRKVGKRSMASHFSWHRREGLVCFNAPARLLLRSHFSANCFSIRKALLLKLSCCSYHSDLSRSHCLENSEQTSEYAKQPNTTRRKNVWIHIWHWATVLTAMDKAPLRQGCLVSKRKRCNISEKIEKKKRKLSVRDLSQNRKVDGIGQAQTCRSPAKFRDKETHAPINRQRRGQRMFVPLFCDDSSRTGITIRMIFHCCDSVCSEILIACRMQTVEFKANYVYLPSHW